MLLRLGSVASAPVVLLALGTVIPSSRGHVSTVRANRAVTDRSDAAVLGGEDHSGLQEYFRSLETIPSNVPTPFEADAVPGDCSGVTANHIDMAKIDWQKENENTFTFDYHTEYGSSLNVAFGSTTSYCDVYFKWRNPDARRRGVSELREVGSKIGKSSCGAKALK